MTKDGRKILMLLGGIYYLKPAIDVAHKMGLYVITADYLPDNIAHQWSDEYVNVSIVDRESVLRIAKNKRIDAILSYAVDPGVTTAAYVAEKMNLPFPCSYKAACVLQDKASFRSYLRKCGFNVPFSNGYTDKVNAINDCILRIRNKEWKLPIIVKPTDCAGSKGVSKVSAIEELDNAVNYAYEKSINGSIIIESFLEKESVSSGSECLVVNGKILFNGIYDQFFDLKSANTYTPAAEYWPTIHDNATLSDFSMQLQKLISKLGITNGLINVEWRKCIDGKVYLMELSPRAGGNRLAEIIYMASGIDLVDASIKLALGMQVDDLKFNGYDGYWTGIVIHSSRTGFFNKVEIADSFKPYIRDMVLYVNKGEKVNTFNGANSAIGSVFMQFDTNESLQSALQTQNEWLKIYLI